MKKKILLGVLVLIAIVGIAILIRGINKTTTIVVDVSKLTYNGKKIKSYTQETYDEFISDYKNNKLPKIYITDFVFDGAGMYKEYDLDDYIEDGNNYEPKVYTTIAFNVNTTGNIEFTGSIEGGMILVNTNNIKGDINLILNNLKLDTGSKKAPAIYVYNKDINYTNHKVTIIPKKGTKNYIEGGKLKKVSLIDKDNLDSEKDKYTGETLAWYNEYTNYYGVFNSNEIHEVLFATVQADNDDLKDGDPVYFYKAAGAISSDIDLYFEGEGYLKVTSKNKEGIETKGNLTLSGGIGDYEVYADDDCLNTTTKSSIENARNTLYINVNSLTAIVSLDADEGDAIDSNGTLTIDGGKIIAIAHPGQDAGLDGELGTYINGGVIIATGDMFDQVSENSKQNFMALTFNEKVEDKEKIVLKDSSNNIVFEYETDRNYSNLVYSSSKLVDEEYTLYKDDIQLGYSNKGNAGGMPQGGMEPPSGDRPENNMMEPPSGDRPEMPPEEMSEPQGGFNMNNMGEPTNKEFKIEGISNLFSGVGEYKEI